MLKQTISKIASAGPINLAGYKIGENSELQTAETIGKGHENIEERKNDCHIGEWWPVVIVILIILIAISYTLLKNQSHR